MSKCEDKNGNETCLCKYCENEVCYIKMSNGKPSKNKNNNTTENHGEILFKKAVKILIKEGKIDDYYYDQNFDNFGIDFVLTKYININNKKIRIALHIQVKQGENGIEKHENRYPVIPAILINPELPIEEIKEKIMAFFLKNFEPTCYYPSILLDFEKAAKH